ncbi:helix-turn-helix transcriptional regulator [Lachnospiraceae bacterium 50-23]|jgi:transcriptional regulator with XRE-family HTH domain|nr:helix-turn-helix transcriptional regulator [Dorea sp.]
MSFDKKLKALRLENKMTQEYVASRLNVARSTIAGYETKNRQPSHEKLASIASLFHVTIDYLLDETDSIELNPSQGVIYSDTEKNLVLRYRKLSAQSRKELLSYIDLLELRDSQNG